MKKIFKVAIVVLFLIIFFTSCSKNNNTTQKAVIQTSPSKLMTSQKNSTQKTTSQKTTSQMMPSQTTLFQTSPSQTLPSLPAKTILSQTITQTPTIIQYNNVAPGKVAIAGTVEVGSRIIVRGGVQEEQTNSHDKYFMITVNIDNPNMSELKIYAKVNDKEESQPAVISAKYNSSAKTISTVSIGNNYQLHFGSSTPDFLRNNLFSTSQIKQLVDTANDRARWLKQDGRNAELIYVIVPGPLTIYPESAPNELTPQNNESRLEQFTKALKASDVTVFNLKDLFMEHKNEQNLYYKTDSHWNEYAGYIAYKELFDYIKVSYPAAAPRPLTDFELSMQYTNGGDLLQYINFDKSQIRDYSVSLKPKFVYPLQFKKFDGDSLQLDARAIAPRFDIKNDNATLPKGVVFRCSYGTHIMDIMSDRFNRVVFDEMWQYRFDRDLIQEVNPDYVIYILAERNIFELLKDSYK